MQQHGDRVLRLAFAYLKSRSDAQDVAQDVFLTYWRKAPVFADAHAQRAWLMHVTANRCKDICRSAWRRRTVPLMQDLQAIAAPSRQILEQVLSLQEKYRIPLHLFYYEGYHIDEIARILGTKPATVGTWLARGRALLRKQLEGEGEDAR